LQKEIRKISADKTQSTRDEDIHANTPPLVSSISYPNSFVVAGGRNPAFMVDALSPGQAANLTTLYILIYSFLPIVATGRN